MRMLIWGFAGRTYHIVGNLMSQLKYNKVEFYYKNTSYTIIKLQNTTYKLT